MIFHGQFRKLFHVSEPTISKQFFSKLEFLFFVLGSMVSKNICKLHQKLKNSKHLPELTWSWQNKPWYKHSTHHHSPRWNHLLLQRTHSWCQVSKALSPIPGSPSNSALQASLLWMFLFISCLSIIWIPPNQPKSEIVIYVYACYILWQFYLKYWYNYLYFLLLNPTFLVRCGTWRPSCSCGLEAECKSLFSDFTSYYF